MDQKILENRQKNIDQRPYKGTDKGKNRCKIIFIEIFDFLSAFNKNKRRELGGDVPSMRLTKEGLPKRVTSGSNLKLSRKGKYYRGGEEVQVTMDDIEEDE